MKFLSLFTGCGAFDLGLERAGMTCVGQCEIDPFCRAVLAKHWPAVPRWEDVKTLSGDDVRRAAGPVDCIAGGFPCQDISLAGSGEGLAGKRSGLWSQFFRLIRDLRPRFVIVENVAALRSRGLVTVLGDLASIGFDAEWSTLSSCAMGATHMRRRLFIVAHSDGQHGAKGVRTGHSPAFRPLQAFNGFESARADAKARMENPSELYRGADAAPRRMDRNRAVGNAVDPHVAEWIGRRLMEAI